MHNPKLNHRLHRISAPTMFLRGDSDGLVSEKYLQGLRGACAEGPHYDRYATPGTHRIWNSPRRSQPRRSTF